MNKTVSFITFPPFVRPFARSLRRGMALGVALSVWAVAWAGVGHRHVEHAKGWFAPHVDCEYCRVVDRGLPALETKTVILLRDPAPTDKELLSPDFIRPYSYSFTVLARGPPALLP